MHNNNLFRDKCRVSDLTHNLFTVNANVGSNNTFTNMKCFCDTCISIPAGPQ